MCFDLSFVSCNETKTSFIWFNFNMFLVFNTLRNQTIHKHKLHNICKLVARMSVSSTLIILDVMLLSDQNGSMLMIAFGPSSKNMTGWYLFLSPDPFGIVGSHLLLLNL